MAVAPDQLGPFQIEAEIGRGGMGVVYRAHDHRLDRQVAIKAVAPDLLVDSTRLQRFRHEARLLAQLNHPHIAQVHQLLEDDGRTYLVLEYIPGRSLGELIDADGALEMDRALSIGAQVARAMEAAHRRDIIHRDLKPNNIRITDDGTAKVLDFGIALSGSTPAPALSALPRSGDSTVLADPPPTGSRHGVVVGTPGYMSPEQARGEPVDARSDVFAFGCVLFECLVGRRAFPGETTGELIAALGSVEPDWSSLPAPLPEPVRVLLQDCLARQVEERPATMGQVRAALDTALGRRDATPPATLAASAIANNLPAPMTSFVGRRNQLRDLADQLRRAKLLTLLGFGGCGKTRLSVELAARAAGDFPDGVYIVELASISNPDLVPAAVAATLGVKDAPNRTTIQAVSEHLADHRLLLILDNCEHVLDAAASVVEALLRSAPGVRVLATSRTALGIPGEMTWRVPILDLPGGTALAAVGASEAAMLFVDRARHVKPSFTLTDENAPAVARICRRLDGIPLALELAAARLRVLTPAEIEHRLDDRFRLLKSEARGVMPHHRTLHAAVDWSYVLLTDCERRMLRALAVFAGGWTIDAAVAVCADLCATECDRPLDEFEVMDMLTRLIDQSLVIVDEADGASRYRLLDTVREYACQKLQEDDEVQDASRRHLDYFLVLAEQAAAMLTGPDQAAWLARLDVEHENILAALQRSDALEDGAMLALRLCGAMMRFWLLHGHFKTGLSLCAHVLEHEDAQAQTAARAAALHTAGVMNMMLGDYERSTWFEARSLEISRVLNDSAGIAQALNSLGNAAYYRGELENAARFHEESLSIKRGLNDESAIATSLNNLGNVASDGGRLDEAQQLYEEALRINRKAGNRAWEAINVNNLALVAYHKDELADARRLHEDSLAMRRELGDKHGIAESLSHLGDVALAWRDLDEARRLYVEALDIRNDVGDKLGLADSLDEIGQLAILLGEHERGVRLIGSAEALRANISSPRPRPEQRDLDEQLDAARTVLKDATCDAALHDGKARPLDDAIADALTWLRA